MAQRQPRLLAKRLRCSHLTRDQQSTPNGYYDLATPFFATEYTFSHLGGDPSLLTRVTQTYYESGHMMYIHRPSLEKLTAAVREFMHRALERPPGEMAADNGV